jgi:hypothetical protein
MKKARSAGERSKCPAGSFLSDPAQKQGIILAYQFDVEMSEVMRKLSFF